MTEELTIVCPFCQKDDITFVTATEFNLGFYECNNDKCPEYFFKAELTRSED